MTARRRQSSQPGRPADQVAVLPYLWDPSTTAREARGHGRAAAAAGSRLKVRQQDRDCWRVGQSVQPVAVQLQCCAPRSRRGGGCRIAWSAIQRCRLGAAVPFMPAAHHRAQEEAVPMGIPRLTPAAHASGQCSLRRLAAPAVPGGARRARCRAAALHTPAHHEGPDHLQPGADAAPVLHVPSLDDLDPGAQPSTSGRGALQPGGGIGVVLGSSGGGRGGGPKFADWLQYCRMLVQSERMLDWKLGEGALGAAGAMGCWQLRSRCRPACSPARLGGPARPRAPHAACPLQPPMSCASWWRGSPGGSRRSSAGPCCACCSASGSTPVARPPWASWWCD